MEATQSTDIKKALRLPKLEYFETHLSLINCLLPQKMTPTEIKLLATFMSLEGHISQYRFGPTAKKVVREMMKISVSGMSNYITSLTNKGFLKVQGDVTSIWHILEPQKDQQMYMFKLINNG